MVSLAIIMVNGWNVLKGKQTPRLILPYFHHLFRAITIPVGLSDYGDKRFME